jgi:hypothetical protein
LLHLAGRDKVGYYHELFLRSKRFLAQRIQRIKIKGEGARKPSSPETEPNFYNVPYLPSTRAPSRNPWIASVGNMGHLGPNMNVGTTGGEVSLQRLLAIPAFPASFQQQPPPLNNSFRPSFISNSATARYLCIQTCKSLPAFSNSTFPWSLVIKITRIWRWRWLCLEPSKIQQLPLLGCRASGGRGLGNPSRLVQRV